MFGRMIPLAEPGNEIEREIACGHSKLAGIDAIVLKDDAGSMFPSLQETEGVRLLVPQAQMENAWGIPEERKTRG